MNLFVAVCGAHNTGGGIAQACHDQPAKACHREQQRARWATSSAAHSCRCCCCRVACNCSCAVREPDLPLALQADGDPLRQRQAQQQREMGDENGAGIAFVCECLHIKVGSRC